MTRETLEIGPLRVGERLVRVETNDRAFANVVHRAFADLAPGEGGRQKTDVVSFEVRRRDEPWRQWFVRRDGQPCESTTDDGYVLFHLQWELNRVVLEGSKTTVHAAAIDVDGRAIIFSGPSGSGKTTFTGWMVAHGDGFLADEVVALDEDGQACDYHRPLGIRHGGPLEPFFSPADRPDPPFGGYEMLLPASALAARLTPGPLPVAAVLFPRYDPDAPSELRHVSKAESLSRLAANAPSLARLGRATFRCLAGVIAGATTAELSYSDLPHAEALVRELLRTRAARA